MSCWPRAQSGWSGCGANAAALREGLRSEGLEPIGSDTQIVPLVIGEADDAMALCERLLEEGIFAQAIRPPTVPPGTCRLRLTVMATHRVADLRHAARRIGGAPHASSALTAAESSPATPPSFERPPDVRGLFVTGTGTEVGKTVVAVRDRIHGARSG